MRPTPRVLERRAFTLTDQVPMLPGSGYASRIESPAPADVVDRSTWEPGCPVARDGLAWLRLTFWGFDARRHTGELLVNAAVVDDLDRVFARLYDARFPLEQVLIVRSIDEEAPPTGDGNGTGSFVCRADDRRHGVLPARLRPGGRRQHVPESLREGREWCCPSSPPPTSTASTCDRA